MEGKQGKRKNNNSRGRGSGNLEGPSANRKNGGEEGKQRGPRIKKPKSETYFNTRLGPTGAILREQKSPVRAGGCFFGINATKLRVKHDIGWGGGRIGWGEKAWRKRGKARVSVESELNLD